MIISLSLQHPFYSVSTSLGNLTVGTVPVGITTPPADLGDEIEVFTLLLFDLNSLEGDTILVD